jgi:NAD(P)-dependent dehydrogenase (short-subunit alcohol dehydrogenase family)
MTTATITAPAQPKPELLGQTVVVLGDGATFGLETARRARAEGADVILVARDPERLQHAARELGLLSTAAFDVADARQLEQFFDELSGPIDHVIVTAGGSHYEPLAEMDVARTRRFLDEHLTLPLQVARNAAGKIRPGGTLLVVDGTAARRPEAGLALGSAVTVGMPALVASLALELAPVRVNLIAAGVVDTPVPASLNTLPSERVVGPDDVAALAVHVMANAAVTGATYDIDRGQQLLSRGLWRWANGSGASTGAHPLPLRPSSASSRGGRGGDAVRR